MPEVFYGQWAVAVASHESRYDQRFTISGSDANDGTYDVGDPPPMNVFGAEWTVTIEWKGPGGWQASQVRRSPTYTAHDGLVITLGADVHAEGDYDEMVLTLRNLEPPVNPWRPVVNPYDFTLPRETIDKYRKGKGGRGREG
jgi:hypothetical protein